jgi:hypothetical protein
MNWFQKNFKNIIYVSFLIPILLVAFVSISHVTSWYGITNPFSWAVYLSIGIEIAALSALAAISANMGRVVYIPFGIVTFIQFLGNIFFAYQFIDTGSQTFKDWVEMVDPVVSYIGVEEGDPISHKRFLALFAGGMLPLISLSFLHMLVKFEEKDKKNPKIVAKDVDIDEVSIEAGKLEAEIIKEMQDEKINPTPEEIEALEKVLEQINKDKFSTLTESEEPVQEEKKTNRLSYINRNE